MYIAMAGTAFSKAEIDQITIEKKKLTEKHRNY